MPPFRDPGMMTTDELRAELSYVYEFDAPANWKQKQLIEMLREYRDAPAPAPRARRDPEVMSESELRAEILYLGGKPYPGLDRRGLVSLLRALRDAYAPAAPPPAPKTYSRTIHLRGATGMYQHQINGTYVMSGEVYGGFPRYLKRNSGEAQGIWIEYYSATGAWHVKNGSNKGMNQCYALVQHNGDLRSCPNSSKWQQVTAFGNVVLNVTTYVDEEAERMDKAPFVPVIDARVFSDLQSLRGRKDLVVQRTAGYFEDGWEFPRGNQPYIKDYSGNVFVKLTKNVAGFASLFGFLPQVLEKEVEVNELISHNPVKPPPAKLFGFVPIPIPRPPPVMRPGIAKPKPVPGVRSVWLMSMPEIKAELYKFEETYEGLTLDQMRKKLERLRKDLA